ncbi:MAG: ABC transporter permease, partial [Chloroflexota bacterium]|nr:ABC transporter permease [Chloroflexota bacterium]
DQFGRDILSRIVIGSRQSLQVALLAILIASSIGTAFGLVSGYFGGWVDSLLMRLVDVLLAIPGLALLILITTLYRPGPVGLAFVLAGVSWPGIARIIRGEVLSLRRREYIEAARVVGAPAWRILTRHLLPNIMPLIVIYAAIAIPVLIVDEAALSYLGVGVQVPTPSWGNMLGEATQFLRAYPAKVIIPGAMIYLTSLALYLVGNGIRDAFDPRLGD